NGEIFSDTAALMVSDVVITRLEITSNQTSVTVGLSIPLTATAYLSDGTTLTVTDHDALNWVSLNPSVATVSSVVGDKGLVTGVGAGNVVIRASGSANGKPFSADIMLTVNSAVVTGLSIIPPNDSVAAGNSTQFTVLAMLDNGQLIDVSNEAGLSYSSDNVSIATIISNQRSRNGMATGKEPGIVTITAKGWATESTATLTVNNAQITELSVIPNDIEVAKTLQQSFTALATMSNGQKGVNVTNSSNLDWSTDNSYIATVTSGQLNNNGLVTTINAGAVNIIASVKDLGITASSQMTVLNTSLSRVFGLRWNNDKSMNYPLGSSNNMTFRCGAIVDAIGTPELGMTGGSGGTKKTTSGINVSSIEVSWG
ncbi:MAG: Ig-like domain-containing protein, partial [Plesiomonas sp.]